MSKIRGSVLDWYMSFNTVLHGYVSCLNHCACALATLPLRARQSLFPPIAPPTRSRSILLLELAKHSKGIFLGGLCSSF